MAPAQVIYSTPVGLITGAVSSAEVDFSTPMNPYSFTAGDVSLTGPGGLVMSNLNPVALTHCWFRIDFPTLTAQGDYTLTVGPQVQDLFGQPMSEAFTGTFSIAWATVQGSVTDSNGLPVPGVLLQPDGGFAGATTDTNGNYVLALPAAGTIQVTPSKAGLVFVPSARTYNGVPTPINNENYLAVGTVVPTLTSQVQTNGLVLGWYGISGVTYQPFSSTNLVDWLPYDGPLSGTNGPLQLVVPMITDPIMFFRMGASY